jgi:hypothetical protein
MTDTDPQHDDAHPVHRPFHWSSDDFKGLAIGVGALVVWGVLILLFGFAGLILPALLLVALSFVALLIISRG